MATYKLINLRFNQAANLVDVPANPKAHVVLFKRAEPAVTEEIVKEENNMVLREYVKKFTDLFKEAGALTDWAAQEEREHQISASFNDRLGKALESGDLEAIKNLHKEMSSLIAAACGTMKSLETPALETPAALVPPVSDTRRYGDPDPSPTPEDVEKAAKLIALEKKLVETEEVLKSEREATALAAEVAILKSIKLVSVNPEADAPIFKSLKETNEVAYNRVMELIKGADAIVATSTALTTDVGSPLPGDKQSGNTAWAQIEAEADTLRKEDPKITKAKAIDIVMKKRPDLVTAHNAEMGA